MDPSYVAAALSALLSGRKRGLGRAVLLTGPWGCGKTFLWSEVTPKLGRPTVYVSAFGAESAAQFKSRLVTQALLSGAADTASKVPRLTDLADKLAQAVPRLASKARSLAKGSVDALVGTLLHRLEVDPLEVAGLLPEETVICVDDLERAAPSFSIESLLGIVNGLTEQRRFDVLLICNEDQIGSVGSGRRDAYRMYKEKTVHTQITLRANVAELYERIVGLAVVDIARREQIKGMKDVIVDTFNRSSTENLRALARVFSAIELYLGAAGIIEEARVRLLCALAIEETEGRQHPAEFYRFNDVAIRVASRMASKEPTEQDQKRMDFVERYFGEIEYSFDAGIFDLVRNGYLSAEAIRSGRLESPAKLSQLNAALKSASQGSWVAMHDAEVKCLIGDLCSGLDTDPDCDARRLLEGLAWARHLAETLGDEIPGNVGIRVAERLMAMAERGDDSVDQTWEMYLDFLQSYVETEKEEYKRVAEGHAHRRARELIDVRLVTPDDSLAKLVANSGGDALRFLLGEMSPERMLRVRKSHPEAFRLLAHVTLKRMGEMRAIWPEVNERYEQVLMELERIAADDREERMDRWRARQLLPRGYKTNQVPAEGSGAP